MGFKKKEDGQEKMTIGRVAERRSYQEWYAREWHTLVSTVTFVAMCLMSLDILIPSDVLPYLQFLILSVLYE